MTRTPSTMEFNLRLLGVLPFSDISHDTAETAQKLSLYLTTGWKCLFQNKFFFCYVMNIYMQFQAKYYFFGVAKLFSEITDHALLLLWI